MGLEFLRALGGDSARRRGWLGSLRQVGGGCWRLACMYGVWDVDA